MEKVNKSAEGFFIMAMFIAIMLLINSISLAASPEKEMAGLNRSEITTSWNLSILFKDRETATAEFERLQKKSQEINATFRPRFENLTGKALLEFIEENKNFSRNLSVVMAYVYAQNSLNVNDKFFENFISDVQNLYTAHAKATSFADVLLKSLSPAECNRLLSEQPGLENYRAYLENSYWRYRDHRPRNESHAAYLADISNQLMKINTEAEKKVTNNVTVAGNITLENGSELTINSQTYSELLSTSSNRNNRKMGYDKRFYHLINESDKMCEIYVNKSRLDDQIARELNYSDSYDAKMFETYLTKEQVETMNQVFKERKGDFDGYYEFRRTRMNLERLKPYDLALQLLKNPDKKYGYEDTLSNISASYAAMDPAFQDIFTKTTTSGSIDVYPNPEGGKQPGGYCLDMCALRRPALIFMNFKGLMNDQKTLTHEMGHAVNFYLMGNNVDYLYCAGTEYEMEIPSTFNEELFVDYALKNYDQDTALAILAETVSGYENYFTFQPMITEFENKAHELCRQKENVRGGELNMLWTNLSKEYRSSLVDYYPEDGAQWTYISHIYLTNNYYTFSYALSKAVTLSLFKMYKENPEKFNENYIAYLSAGSTMTPSEKLKKFFGIEIDRKLFEDAMDIVQMRVLQLQELEEKRLASSA
ncbi:MAG: M3 family oligoendopeptidase [Methanothrix sp.]|nr:M3 family oligoendopeptidase [Methanothrix sp.]